MFNYLIKIEYDGTNYVGWQYQKNGISVQEKIEKTLKKILKSKTKIIAAGRTDKGVHAEGQFANFKVKKKIEDEKKFLNSINFFLRKNLISIINIKKKKKLIFILDTMQKKEFMNTVLLIDWDHYH